MALLPQMSDVLWQECSTFWHYLFDGQLDSADLPDLISSNVTNNPFTLGHAYHARQAHIPDPNNQMFNWYAASCRKAIAYEVLPPEAPNIADNEIETDRKIWRPSLPSRYIEPDPGPDLLDGMELIFKDYGKSLRKSVVEIPARTDIITFDPALHSAENLRWGDYPEEHRGMFKDIIKKYWDVFAAEGLRKPILGYQCRVDTGDAVPICCKLPRY